MMKKRKIVLVILLIAIVGGVTSIFFLHKEGSGINEEDERTAEEYIAVLLDNKEDFDYVANAMQQLTSASSPSHINFYLNNDEIVIDDCFSTNSQEIADEILNNNEFYNHLQNIYRLDEIRRVACVKSTENTYIIDEIDREIYVESSDECSVHFTFIKFRKNFHGGLIYRGYGLSYRI